MSAPAEVLMAAELAFRYPTGRGVAGVSFGVSSGETIGVLGPNGSGKSTLLRLLAGLLTSPTGQLTLFGQKTPPLPARLRRRLGMLFDAPAHFDHLTGRENAAFFAAAYGLGQDQVAARLPGLAERFGLAAQLDDRMNDYSFGMRRKLALIEALLSEPDLLLLDEPGAGLDYAARLALREALQAHRRRGGAVVMATNDVAEAQRLSQRVLFLHEGRRIACAPPATLLARLNRGRRVTLQLAAPISLEPLAALPAIQQVSAAPEQEVILLSRNGRQSVAEIVNTVQQQGGEITALSVDAPNLGDVFLALTGHPLEDE